MRSSGWTRSPARCVEVRQRRPVALLDIRTVIVQPPAGQNAEHHAVSESQQQIRGRLTPDSPVAARSPRRARDPNIILETKLRPPPLRGGLIERAHLVRRPLDAAASIVVVRAPAGYGKTTVLAQYAVAAARPLVWLSLDEADDDPVLLLLELATALARVAPLDARVPRSLRAPEPAIQRVVLPGLLNCLGRVPDVVVALDGLHHVESPASLRLVASLCDHLPPGAQLLIACRGAASLPLSRLRVRGGLVEIGAQNLALGRADVDTLMRAAGVGLANRELDGLLERTEGWPAAVSLAALAFGAASVPRRVATDLVSGGNRDVVDYLFSELLSGQPPERLSFLLQTSILGRFTASLCDAVLEREDSASIMAEIDAADLFLIPLDDARHWYRYHHLFQDILETELMRRGAQAARTLHRRAAEWHAHHGTSEDAVHHALAGRDTDRATELVLRSARELVNTGRHATARRWVEAFSDEDVAGSAPLALAGAVIVGLLGEKERVRRYVALAKRAHWEGTGVLGETSRGSALALVSALFGWDGVSRMQASALTAYRLEPAGQPAHEPAALALGCSLTLLGRARAAEPLLEEAAALGAGRGSVALIALGELTQVALAEGRIDAAEARAREGLALAEGLDLEEQTASACVHAAAACVGAQIGNVDARAHLMRALALLARLGAFPWLSIQTRIALGRAASALGDLTVAESLFGETRRELARFPDAGVLPRMLARGEHVLEAARGGGGELDEPLTNAERRVLELLPTHLSTLEIGEALHISRTTVKPHLASIYRKLGVARRSDAVARAWHYGLIDHASRSSVDAYRRSAGVERARAGIDVRG